MPFKFDCSTSYTSANLLRLPPQKHVPLLFRYSLWLKMFSISVNVYSDPRSFLIAIILSPLMLIMDILMYNTNPYWIYVLLYFHSNCMFIYEERYDENNFPLYYNTYIYLYLYKTFKWLVYITSFL